MEAVFSRQAGLDPLVEVFQRHKAFDGEDGLDAGELGVEEIYQVVRLDKYFRQKVESSGDNRNGFNGFEVRYLLGNLHAVAVSREFNHYIDQMFFRPAFRIDESLDLQHSCFDHPGNAVSDGSFRDLEFVCDVLVRGPAVFFEDSQDGFVHAIGLHTMQIIPEYMR